jgi:hypothetical protein
LQIYKNKIKEKITSMTKEEKSKLQTRAIGILEVYNLSYPGQSPFEWLVGINLLANGGRPETDSEVFRGEILTELGRIPHDIELRCIAGEICDLRMETATAKRFIQSYLDFRQPENAARAFGALREFIDKYRTKHPEVNALDIYKAVVNLETVCRDDLNMHTEFLDNLAIAD